MQTDSDLCSCAVIYRQIPGQLVAFHVEANRSQAGVCRCEQEVRNIRPELVAALPEWLKERERGSVYWVLQIFEDLESLSEQWVLPLKDLPSSLALLGAEGPWGVC